MALATMSLPETWSPRHPPSGPRIRVYREGNPCFLCIFMLLEITVAQCLVSEGGSQGTRPYTSARVADPLKVKYLPLSLTDSKEEKSIHLSTVL